MGLLGFDGVMVHEVVVIWIVQILAYDPIYYIRSAVSPIHHVVR